MNKQQSLTIQNYVPYPVINYNGKEYEKYFICITEPLFSTAEINTS